MPRALAEPRHPGKRNRCLSTVGLLGSLMATIVSFARLFVGLIYLGILVAFGIVCLIPIVFWHTKRIRLTNLLGTAIGKGIMFISGCPMHIKGMACL